MDDLRDSARIDLSSACESSIPPKKSPAFPSSFQILRIMKPKLQFNKPGRMRALIP